MRTWNISSSLGGRGQISSNARTWGELKNDVANAGYSISNMNFNIRVDNGFMSGSDSDMLPHTGNVIALTPTATKNGI